MMDTNRGRCSTWANLLEMDKILKRAFRLNVPPQPRSAAYDNMLIANCKGTSCLLSRQAKNTSCLEDGKEQVRPHYLNTNIDWCQRENKVSAEHMVQWIQKTLVFLRNIFWRNQTSVLCVHLLFWFKSCQITSKGSVKQEPLHITQVANQFILEMENKMGFWSKFSERHDTTFTKGFWKGANINFFFLFFCDCHIFLTQLICSKMQ